MFRTPSLPSFVVPVLFFSLMGCGTTPSTPFGEAPIQVGDTDETVPVFDVSFDAEPGDAEQNDAEQNDAEQNDAGVEDSSTNDAEPVDAGPADTAPSDAVSPPVDTGAPDVSPDAPVPDVGTPDVRPDTGPDVPPGVEICNNGIDDDGDGYVDCRDLDCADADRCQIHEICDNGIDDDGDGWVDCLDPDCERRQICLERPTETVCDDGIDNDGDGFIDCADRDCLSDPRCGSERCTDGFDNDGDGLTDCDDPDCRAHTSCSGPPRETVCDDGIDNDGDGLTDCDDSDCRRAPACTRPEICDNNIDDDGDNAIDCGDPDCAGDPACDEGNCSARDMTTLSRVDYQTIINTCALPCLGGNTRSCIRECVVDETGISAGCGDCFGGLGECGLSHCLAPCAVDPGGPACLDCFVDSCGDDFSTCSGFDLDF